MPPMPPAYPRSRQAPGSSSFNQAMPLASALLWSRPPSNSNSVVLSPIPVPYAIYLDMYGAFCAMVVKAQARHPGSRRFALEACWLDHTGDDHFQKG